MIPSFIGNGDSVQDENEVRGVTAKMGGVGRNPLLPRTTKRRITTNLKINKQPKVPENQTAWNTNNQGIKEINNQNHQTGKAADLRGQLRKTQKTRQTVGTGLAAELCGLRRRG